MEVKMDEREGLIVGDTYKYTSNSYDRYVNEERFFPEMTEDNFYELTLDVINYIKTKGLTIRQAQTVLKYAVDVILDVVEMN